MSGRDTDPRRLEGSTEDSKPREFFWDSITLYIVGVIISLAAIDVLTEFIRGTELSCLVPQQQEPREEEESGSVSESFINNYCAASVSKSEFFPAFITVHGILIAIPHYLWANHYGGNFEFFFSLMRDMSRVRSEETGDYPDKNYIILTQLRKAFSTYRENWMFVLYAIKLTLQLIITLTGFFAAAFFFHDFSDVFLCPRDFNSSSTSHLYWPLEEQVPCVFTSMRLFAAIRIADLILLTILILSFSWSLIWCGSTHPTELGSDGVASFCFQSSMSPNHYVSRFPLNFCYTPIKRFLRVFFTSVPFCGSGPHISTNLDFLVLKLFRTDSGLGYVFREMQVLLTVKHYNDDDQRKSSLHRRQQKLKMMEDGDIISYEAVQGYKRDLGWRFTKQAGSDGVYNSRTVPLCPEETLVLPRSIRGAVLGFSSLASVHKRAVFITFGSVSLGIPSALARVFTKVGVLNFNPYFKRRGEDGLFYIEKNLCSDITELSFPEDILAAEYSTSNDFSVGLKKLFTTKVNTIDFLFVGPVESELHLSTVSLCLSEIASTRFNSNSILLTIYPKEISSKSTGSEFYQYLPPEKYFKSLKQRVCLNNSKTDQLYWPPRKPSNNDTLKSTKQNPYEFKLSIGGSEGTFQFLLYKYSKQEVEAKPALETKQEAVDTKEVVLGGFDGGGGGGEGGGGDGGLDHHAIDLSLHG